MTKAYKQIIFSLLFIASSTAANAQNKAENDSTLNRQVLLERDFNPTLQDAFKINTLPAIHEPVVKQVNAQFEERQPTLNFSNFPIGDTGSGDIKTGIDFNKKRGYLSVGAGTRALIDGKAGYRILDSTTDKLDILARYNSINGKVNYTEQNDGLKDAKVKYDNLLIATEFQHAFSASTWSLNGGYENTGFNYYGKPSSAYLSGSVIDMNKKQLLSVVQLGTGLKSKDNNLFRYNISLKYDYFTTKYNPYSYTDKGISGNIINAALQLEAPFRGDKLIGVRFGLLNQSFKKPDFVADKVSFHSLTKFSVTPHLDIDGGNYLLSLGLASNYAADSKNKFLVAPDLGFSWQFVDKTSFYADITGKINENTYLQTMQENRYFNQGSKVHYSRTPFDGTAGFRSGVIEGFEFDLSGGYKQTIDEHLYINDIDGLLPEYVNLGTGHFSGLIKTSLIPNTDLSAKLTGYFYKVDGDDFDGGPRTFGAWNLPKMTFDLSAYIKPADALNFSISYKLATGREALDDNTIRKMKSINELNLGGAYKITDWLSINAKVNNILNQRYDIWYGYTHLGFNAMAGISLVF
ncbi:TonB-dependent receptor [Viscerimonas tarda]